ncbi:LysR family transcriptional regulator [Arthrobacter sp. H14-L1]|uniref:LysR family transcriptional regulator n=1 Tax=Arthrobacter sp. H14-L1 TaxID=2996697 RepID=UPI002270BA40|nr:LysR family transcriptional regulator [Arthrobacter sp. H14-L1]MCY0906377.1 LysR family transcriptional regulator [Arthrobacter sp. H14-L1]
MISADDLRYFLEVCRTGTLVSAARGLGVDHTTVGRRITQLEKASGARLFVRTPGGWRPTEAGERLAVHAEAVESSILSASEELGSPAGRLAGTLRIATPDGFGAFVLSPGLGNLRARHPDLKVEIVTATRLNLLASKEFDVGISLARPTIRGVESFELADYPLGLYASADYLRRRGPVRHVGELLEHPVIGYVDSLLDIPALRFLDALVPGVRPAIQTNNITGQWMATVAGLGVAVLPSFIAESDRRLVHILEKSVAIRRKYWLAVPRELQGLARILAARQELEELVRSHPYLELVPPAGPLG